MQIFLFLFRSIVGFIISTYEMCVCSNGFMRSSLVLLIVTLPSFFFGHYLRFFVCYFNTFPTQTILRVTISVAYNMLPKGKKIFWRFSKWFKTNAFLKMLVALWNMKDYLASTYYSSNPFIWRWFCLKPKWMNHSFTFNSMCYRGC